MTQLTSGYFQATAPSHLPWKNVRNVNYLETRYTTDKGVAVLNNQGEDVFQIVLALSLAKLQNTPHLTQTILNSNETFFVFPRSTKSSEICNNRCGYSVVTPCLFSTSKYFVFLPLGIYIFFRYTTKGPSASEAAIYGKGELGFCKKVSFR